MVREIRGVRFLVDCDAGNGVAFTSVAVCDPLYRRYVLLPPIPQDLAAAVEQPHLANAERRCEVFFVPCSEEEAAAAVTAGSPDPFKVMWMAQCPTKLVAFIFSFACGQWQAVASPSWRVLNPEMPALTAMRSLFWRSYACRCFFWLLSNFPKDCKLLVLNTSTMKFIPAKSPFGCWEKEFAMVELGESKLGMFVRTDKGCYYTMQLLPENGQNNGGLSYKWEQRKELVLSPSNNYDMLGVFDEKLFMQARQGAGPTRGFGCFSVDFHITVIERVRGLLGNEFCPLSALYTGYPPSVSPPAI